MIDSSIALQGIKEDCATYQNLFTVDDSFGLSAIAKSLLITRTTFPSTSGVTYSTEMKQNHLNIQKKHEDANLKTGYMVAQPH